jgi:hypothetical protein
MAVAARKCMVCEQAIGYCCWVYWWGPHEFAHAACHDDARQRELSRVNDPWLIEQAARAGGLTIEGFRALPVWERERRILAIGY